MQRLLKSLSEKISLLSARQEESTWTFRVRGQTLHTYEQVLTPTTFSCSCPDHTGKHTFCKHLLFLVARVALQMERASTLNDTLWDDAAFQACSTSWRSRLHHLIRDETDVVNSPDGHCSICFEEMNATDVLTQCETTCKNWFHTACLKIWKEHGNGCPLCRADMPDIQVTEEQVEVHMEAEEAKTVETDLVISFDTTGSMYPCLAEVRRGVETISKKLFNEIPSLRLAIIAHGDYCDKDKTITTLDFTTDQEAINQFIRDAPSTSGGDYPECYELVLRTSKGLSWRPDAKMKSIILIGDAPPHEKNENPQQIDWREEAESLLNRNIQVFSVQCLNKGNREAYAFYEEVSRMTNGYHLFLDQFSYIKDIIQAICFKQYNQDQLVRFEHELQTGAGGMNATMRLMFDTMLGKKTREDIAREMNPDRFRERYHRPSTARRTAAPSAERSTELHPCSPTKFQVFTVEHDSGIQEFCRLMGITFAKGRGFFEFIKPEIIQPQKEIVLMDKETGQLYEGDVARTIAGIGANEERSRIKPGDLPTYRVFIQSTSSNRKLVAGQGFLYEVRF